MNLLDKIVPPGINPWSPFRSSEQKKFHDYIHNSSALVTFVNADAGIGKTRAMLMSAFAKLGKTLICVPTVHQITQIMEGEDLKVTQGENNIVPFYSKSYLQDVDAYNEQISNMEDAKLVITTQSMMFVNLAMYGRIFDFKQFERIIFDEADKLPATAALFFDDLIPYETLKELDVNSPEDIIIAINAIKKPSDEYKQAKAAAKRMLREYSGTTALTSKGLENKKANPARILKALQDLNVKLIMVSGTLSIDNNFSHFRYVTGFFDAEEKVVETKDFGRMQFMLADRGIEKHDLNYQIKAIEEAKKRGGDILVLTTSYDRANTLFDAVGGVIQRSGEKLNQTLMRYSGGILITPNGWEGLDTEFEFKHVIICNIPFQPEDEVLESDYLSNIQITMRKAYQGMGRGIRHHFHSTTIWILDPRFPLPATLIKKGHTQGLGARNLIFRKSIPKRFREGRFCSYNKAEIFNQ